MSPAAHVRIPIARPLFGPEELRAVQVPLENGYVLQGPFVDEFERRFGAYVGAKHAVTSSSCTSALHLIVAALGVKPGTEVIVPAFTWVATANVVELMGATPVFCDVDLDTFNIDVTQVESLVTERTVGIVGVHLFGLSCDIDPLLEICERHGLWLVEDAACALGGWYRGRHVGTFGVASAFSFHPRKSITTGEGGMVATNDDSIAAATKSLRDHGSSRAEAVADEEDAFLLSDFPRVGFNFRMTDIQGALGCAQMDRLDEILVRRREIAARYDELLAGLDFLERPVVPEGYVHGYQAYVCLFRPDEPVLENVDRMHLARNELMRGLERAGIQTRQGTHAPVLTAYYAQRYDLRPQQFPNAYAADRLSLALPLFPQLTDDDQATVATELERAFARV
jgi:dTDP-4-amino-4,6-dideoxygalactose transaminase